MIPQLGHVQESTQPCDRVTFFRQRDTGAADVRIGTEQQDEAQYMLKVVDIYKHLALECGLRRKLSKAECEDDQLNNPFAEKPAARRSYSPILESWPWKMQKKYS